MITRRLRTCITVACLMALAGCASSIPTAAKMTPEHPLSRSIAAPAGWIDVTDKALSPDVKYWMLAGDRSASLLLKELQPSVPAGTLAPDESIVTAAHISLRLKLALLGNGLRITQAPAQFVGNPAFGVYVYTEKGLLRRVLLFRKRSRLYELELAQETEAEEFSRHLSAQITFAMSVLKE